MKKAFTMIELIFVIVILGILAAVAIPKLNATRDDAEITKGVSNFSTLLSDIASYYTAKGSFATNIQDMTNVVMQPHTSNTSTAYLYIKDLNCVTINAQAGGSTIKIFASPDYNKGVCKSFFATSSVRAAMGNEDIGAHLGNASAYEIKLGGGNVNF
ncbi:type II secretion system protein [Campylobacter sp. RM12651]|uniref:type II secretion system protein n=1 Tax=Campylobacter sp. RM12651 TaxID=1660079 RepID=UPI001EFB0357|nr:type II secretion system protein [Campylobacter sp. RM12651]ULO04298.1 putative type II secretion system protein [Campylobacter sp. RM12651]